MLSHSILANSFYNPPRGGHAPGDIRDAFGEAVDAYEAWIDGEQEPTIEVRDQELAISAVCGLLWCCTDIMPSSLYTQIRDLFRWPAEMPQRRTYAVGARLLKGMIASALVNTCKLSS
jgi:hypothetical protein